MSDYNAPTRDMRFVMNDLGLLPAIQKLPGCEDTNAELVDAVLEEARKLSGGVLAPLNTSGDLEGATLENGVVRAASGFGDAYRQFVDGGWNGIPFDPNYGGQGLPWLVGIAVEEMWISANTAWALCPMLTMGAVDLLSEHGTPEQKATYLEKLISGEWTGTMNLTEPQAGSDVGALRSRAEPEGDHYRIRGQKIFISWGEHDMTDNIVHMVLARTPNAPAGSKGISLFIVPKFLINADGSLGQRNDLRCVSIEHKLGIKASPTCVMSYGDDEGAIGYLVGEENRGLNCMFTMMNNARINVGLSGLSIAERAYQQAVAYARDRLQGTGPDGAPLAIIRHPDVRRMLLTMKSSIEAMRALVYDTATSLDQSRREQDSDKRQAAQARLDLLTPVVKAWCTDLGVEIASMGVQVHGGVGYMEETGAVQHLRDARIAPIYEGTNGIQAQDLVARKVLRDGGAAAKDYIAEVRTLCDALGEATGDTAAALQHHLSNAADALAKTTDWLLDDGIADLARAFSGATPYLKLFGTVAGGAMMARIALAAQAAIDGNTEDHDFYTAKLMSARFYADNILPQAIALVAPVRSGHHAVLAMAEDSF
jgi:alkylation response protein AidB-like acyl-CoA dehydrogenase